MLKRIVPLVRRVHYSTAINYDKISVDEVKRCIFNYYVVKESMTAYGPLRMMLDRLLTEDKHPTREYSKVQCTYKGAIIYEHTNSVDNDNVAIIELDNVIDKCNQPQYVIDLTGKRQYHNIPARHWFIILAIFLAALYTLIWDVISGNYVSAAIIVIWTSVIIFLMMLPM